MMELLVLEIGAMKFGLDAKFVREVQRAAALSPLPESSGAIEGVLNLRGEMVPVIDLHRLIGQPSRAIALSDHIVVIAGSGRVTGVRVDRAVELVPLEDVSTNAAASPLGDMKFVSQAVRVQDQFVHVLDPSKLLAVMD